MKKTLLLLASLSGFAITMGQTQSIVIQKNTINDATTSFSFSTSVPGSSTIPSNFSLIDNGQGMQPNDIGSSTTGTGYIGITQFSTNSVFLYTSGAANWTQPAGNSAYRIDVQSDGTNWQVNGSNQLWHGSTQYGSALDVGVGSDDAVYEVGTNNILYKWSGSGNTWTALSGSPTGKRVDGGPAGTAWFVGSNDHVFEYDGSSSIDHGLSPDGKAFIDISVGSDGKAWAIANSPNSPGGGNYRLVYCWNGTSWTLDPLAPIGTQMFNISVGADNEPMISLNFNGGRTYFLKRLSDGRWITINVLISNNNNIIYYNQPTGSYSFTETVSGGYYLQDILIFGNTNNSFNASTGAAVVNLQSDDHAFVQYTNVTGSKPAATSITNVCGQTYIEDFGQGTSHASLPTGQTNYVYQSAHDVNDGYYTLTNTIANAKGTSYQWLTGASDHDHTGNTDGRMLLVNADFGANIFYEKEYTGLIVGSSYDFSAYLANILLNTASYSTDPNAILRVVDPVTGDILLDIPTGDIKKSGANTLDWKKYNGSFIATSNTIKVYLINNKPGGDGNDIVLDDITFTVACNTITGNVFHDINGLSDLTVNGDGTNTENTLYVVLVNSSNNIAASSTLPADGSFSFLNIAAGSYAVKLTTTAPGTAGSVSPDASLTTGWINTGNYYGENNGAGTGNISSGNLDSIAVSFIASNITNVNFGIEMPPVANNVSANAMINPGGSVKVTVPVLNGSDPEQGEFPGTGNADTIKIQSLPANAQLYYNNVLVTIGQIIENYDPTLLQIDPNDGIITVTFTYSEVDAAGISSVPATVTMEFTTILPLTLTNFEANAIDNIVKLNWSTNNEINTLYFEIERSNDGVNFFTIEKIKAQNSREANTYIITDNLPLPGLGYYRIKITDVDGSISFSTIATCSIKEGYIQSAIIKPNPFVNEIELTIQILKTSKINFFISDMSGKCIYTKICTLNSGVNKIHMNDFGTIPSGVYTLCVSADNKLISTKKLVRR